MPDDDDSYLVTLTGLPCARCGQPKDWHDDELPHAIPRHVYDDDCVDEGCEGYLPAPQES